MVAQSLPKPGHLEPSPLGTKEYWDKLYTTEISNHATDPSDVGTIWFDDSAAEDKILAFLHSPTLGLDTATTSFLDIGTGNGHFLFRLREPFGGEDETESHSGNEDDGVAGEEAPAAAATAHRRKKRRFTGPVLGTDYSLKSIEFARRIALGKQPDPAIEFRYFDVMASEPAAVLCGAHGEGGYDVVLDKGTFDAISLSSELLPSGKRLVEGYRERILPLVKMEGLFLVTSCNWTEGELRGWFESSGDAGEVVAEEFVFVAAVKYRSFRFGGQDGQSVSSVCYRKMIREKTKSWSRTARGSP